MNGLLKAGLGLFTLVAMGAAAQANQKLVLKLGDIHLRGQNTIKLKQKIKQQYPGINLRALDLIKVRLVAKSKHGRGTAELRVGQDYSYPKTVDGRPFDFHDPSGYTFDRIKFQNPSYGSSGAWQILLRGNLIVRKVVLIVAGSYQPGPGPGTLINLGERRTEKFFEMTETFYPNSYQPTQSVQIYGARKDVSVSRVLVFFGNGQVQQLHSLQGYLFEGQTKQAYINYRNITRIEVTASSANLFGSRGSYGIQIIQ